ncbi:MAG: hypothetical protein AB7E24_05285 [Novosphingobium sp.]
MKCISVYVEKLKAGFSKNQQREQLQLRYEAKRNAELIKIVKDDGIFGAREEERQAALAILKKRKEAAGAQKPRG